MPGTVLVAHPGSELFGSDRMALESVRALIDGGYSVTLAIPADGPLAEEATAAGAAVVVVPMLVLRKSLLAPRGWPRLLQDAARNTVSGLRLLRRVRPQVIYVSTVTIPMWPLLGRWRRAAVVTHVHEAEASAWPLMNTALYAPHLLAHEVIVNSRFSLRTMVDRMPRLATRSRVVLNGVAGPPFAPSPPRQTLDGGLRIVYVGRLSHRKGPDLVVSAAARLLEQGREVTVTLIGSVFAGYERYEASLRDLIRTSQLGERVRLVGFDPVVWPWLSAADVLVVPSRVDEPFGNTAVEGALALRPVVAASTSGLKEAGEGRARYFRPGDAEALAQALAALADDWPEARRAAVAHGETTAAAFAPAVYAEAVRQSVSRALLGKSQRHAH